MDFGKKGSAPSELGLFNFRVPPMRKSLCLKPTQANPCHCWSSERPGMGGRMDHLPAIGSYARNGVPLGVCAST